MKNVLLILSFLFTIFSYSQISFSFGLGDNKSESILYKKNGEKINGIVTFPNLEDKDVDIEINNKKNKIKKDEIDSIQIFDSNKKLSYTFVNTKVFSYNIDKNKKEFYEVSKDEIWLCKIITGKASLYLSGGRFGIKKNKMKVVKASEEAYYIIRKGEKYPTIVSIVGLIGTSIGYNKFFKIHGVKYFKDDISIVSKIENKTYKNVDIEKLVEEYNKK